jgi:hypothetical protein
MGQNLIIDGAAWVFYQPLRIKLYLFFGNGLMCLRKLKSAIDRHKILLLTSAMLSVLKLPLITKGAHIMRMQKRFGRKVPLPSTMEIKRDLMAMGNADMLVDAFERRGGTREDFSNLIADLVDDNLRGTAATTAHK